MAFFHEMIILSAPNQYSINQLIDRFSIIGIRHTACCIGSSETSDGRRIRFAGVAGSFGLGAATSSSTPVWELVVVDELASPALPARINQNSEHVPSHVPSSSTTSPPATQTPRLALDRCHPRLHPLCSSRCIHHWSFAPSRLTALPCCNRAGANSPPLLKTLLLFRLSSGLSVLQVALLSCRAFRSPRSRQAGFRRQSPVSIIQARFARRIRCARLRDIASSTIERASNPHRKTFQANPPAESRSASFRRPTRTTRRPKRSRLKSTYKSKALDGKVNNNHPNNNPALPVTSFVRTSASQRTTVAVPPA